MSTYLFLLSHPAHFHMFRNVIDSLQEKGHKAVIVVRPKDVLEQLCNNYGIKYYKVGTRPTTGGKISLASSLIKRVNAIKKIVDIEKPDMLLGSDGVLAYVGTLCRIPSFEFFDDDYSVIKLYANIYFPFYSGLICPIVTNAGRWSNIKIGYEGYQKLAYLHPRFFVPDKEIVRKYLDPDKPYFLLRFANLSAHHDGGIRGLTTEVANKVVEMLKPFGRVLISSERPLEPEFEQYRLCIDPLDIHHIMYHSFLLW